MTPKSRAIREAICSILMQPHELPALWERGDRAPVNGWLDTDQIVSLVIHLVSGAAHGNVYPQLRALANAGEIQYWPAHQSLPLADRVPTYDEQMTYAKSHRAHWRIVPKAAPIHDPALLEEWLAS